MARNKYKNIAIILFKCGLFVSQIMSSPNNRMYRNSLRFVDPKSDCIIN